MKNFFLGLLVIPVIVIGITGCAVGGQQTDGSDAGNSAPQNSQSGQDSLGTQDDPGDQNDQGNPSNEKPTNISTEYRLPERSAELTPEDTDYVLNGSLRDLLIIWGIPGAENIASGASEANPSMLFFSTLRIGSAYQHECMSSLETEQGTQILDAIRHAEQTLEDHVGDMRVSDMVDAWDVPLKLIIKSCL